MSADIAAIIQRILELSGECDKLRKDIFIVWEKDDELQKIMNSKLNELRKRESELESFQKKYIALRSKATRVA